MICKTTTDLNLGINSTFRLSIKRLT